MTQSDGQPPIACSLNDADQRDREHEWSSVLSYATARIVAEGGLTVRFDAQPELAARIADLAVREQQCCPFFSFTLAVAAGDLALSVAAPPEAFEIVTSLFGEP
jgi:MerR family copper efflux transcriptional regulator